MNNIKEYIIEKLNRTKSSLMLEKLKINSKSKIHNYTYSPKNKKELKELIKQLIKERGNNANLNDIDTSEITDMGALFMNIKFNGNISKWDVSNVEWMVYMFNNSSFNGDISCWKINNNITSVAMSHMFDNCPLEKNPPKWYKKYE